MSVPVIPGFKDYSFIEFTSLENELDADLFGEMDALDMKWVLKLDIYAVYIPIEFSQCISSYMDSEQYAGLTFTDYVSRVFNGTAKRSDEQVVEQ
jgi:hypothetical protein